MSTSFAPSTPASVVAGVREELADLDEMIWAAKTPREKLDVALELERAKSQIAALEAELVADMDATNAPAHDQWGSTADYLTAISGGYHGSGSSEVRLARALTTTYQATLEALRTTAISKAQARVIVATVDKVPAKLGLRAVAERAMLTHAETLGATDLRTVGKHLIEVIDPDGSERRTERQLARDERAAHLQRFLSITEDGAGGVWMKGRTSVEDAAIIKTALFPLAGPSPASPARMRTRPSVSTAPTHATTAPGSSTPSSKAAAGSSPPSCYPSRTAPPRGSP